MIRFLPERLILVREARGITQSEFGRKISTVKQHVSQWERGLSKPSVTSLVRICNVYDIDIGYFFTSSNSDKRRMRRLR